VIKKIVLIIKKIIIKFKNPIRKSSLNSKTRLNLNIIKHANMTKVKKNKPTIVFKEIPNILSEVKYIPNNQIYGHYLLFKSQILLRRIFTAMKINIKLKYKWYSSRFLISNNF